MTKNFNLKTFKKIFEIFKLNVLQSIAFFPVVLSLIFIAFAISLIYAENLNFISPLKEKVPYLMVSDKETARTILSTLFGGILSLTVFSFTMVMVVLNQASSNFSPRLLPELISNKRHQIILGFYIGTLQFCMILLIALGSYVSDQNAIGLSVMIASTLGIFCITLFVYFIHSISQAILIHNIVNKVFKSTNKKLIKKLDNQAISSLHFNTNSNNYWRTINSPKTGYFQGFNLDLVSKQLKSISNVIEILPYTNQHIWQNSPLFLIKEPVEESQIEDLLLGVFILPNKHEGNTIITGMLKLTEVAVKAMSPGINDPGTATVVISKLGQLLVQALQIAPKTISTSNHSEISIINNQISAKELLRLTIQPIRNYSKNDCSVSYALLDMLVYLKNDLTLIDSDTNKAITNEIEALIFDLKNTIDNDQDLHNLIDRVAQN